MKMHPRVLPYANCPVVALDTETTGLDWWDRGFRTGGWVLHNPDVGTDYIPVAHETLFDQNEDAKWVADSIHELGKDKKRTWLMHNRQYDENVARHDGVLFEGDIIDTIGLWWTINPHPDPNFSLKGLGARWIDKSAGKEEAALKAYIKKNKLQRYTQVPVDIMAPYAKMDGVLTYKLWELGMKKLPSDQVEVHNTEQEWIRVLSRMAARGIPINMELTQEIIDSHLQRAHEIRVNMAKKTGIRGFNPAGPDQVIRAAAQIGSPIENAQAETLQKSDLPRWFRDGVIDYKQLIHTVGSYQEPMLSIAKNSIDGKVHTSWRTTTKTGRLASSDPINMQGLPKQRDGAGQGIHRVRELIQSTDDLKLIFNDFAQIDVRVGAHYAQDPTLMEVLRDPDGDIHSMVQDEIRAMGIDLDRRDTKELVFGSQYGIGNRSFAAKVSGLSPNGEWVEVDESQAGSWLGAHRRRFPALPRTLQQAESVMKQRGYISLFDGRKVGCPPHEDPHKSFAWLIQGTGAQIIKRAMIATDNWFTEQEMKSRLFMSVHDEIGADAVPEEADITARAVAWFMASVWRECRVPLYVEPSIATPSWAEMEMIGDKVPLDRQEWERWQTGGELLLNAS